MKTVAELKAEIIRQVWPSGVPENLVVSPGGGAPSVYDLTFSEAFAEIEKWVPCEQENHTDVIPFCETFFKCGQTILPAPYGMIRRVGTLIDKQWCDPVWYRQVEFPQTEWEARRLMSLLESIIAWPDGTLPLGISQANPQTDSPYGRARMGLWSIHRKNLYLFPWIQSNEVVYVEWDGIKTEWRETDFVTETQEYKKAIKLYYQYAHERDYGSPQKAALFHNAAKTGSFDEALGDLMWQCRENTKLRDTPLPPDTRGVLTQAMISRGYPPTVFATGRIAHIGNFGHLSNDNEVAVADMIDFWGIEAILTSGNNSDSANYDADLGLAYHEYIAPYTGTNGAPADENKFFPAIGATDDILKMQEFFPELPNNGRYYEAYFGNIHFFVLNSADTEPDGNSSVSQQAEWLKARLALSAAPWKVVVMHRSPYSLEADNSVMQWPFETWGAHLVLAGSDPFYERITEGNVPFINNGLSGRTKAAPSVPTGGRNQYSALYGAGRLTGEPLTLKYEFVAVGGTVIDTVTLTKTDAGITIT